MRRCRHTVDIFDGTTSADRRNKRLKRVVTNAPDPWKAKISKLIDELPLGWTGIGEDIRLLAGERQLGQPHHPNAWGGMVGGAVRKGLLVRNGELRHARGIRSNASLYPVLVRV